MPSADGRRLENAGSIVHESSVLFTLNLTARNGEAEGSIRYTLHYDASTLLLAGALSPEALQVCRHF